MPFITPDVEVTIHASIAEKCKQLQSPPLTIGGIEDHVHVLVRLHPSTAVSVLVHGVKGASSHLLNTLLPPGHGFRWQGGYGAFSLAPPDVGRVRAYVLGQKERHHTGKLLPLLERCGE